MKLALSFLALPILAVQIASAQAPPPPAAAPQAASAPATPAIEDFKPATSNQSGKLYPQVNSERRARFRIEADALAALALSLENSFVKACDAILSSRGRIVITGMGKSGHIGRKWAATMAATTLRAHSLLSGFDDSSMIAIALSGMPTYLESFFRRCCSSSSLG